MFFFFLNAEILEIFGAITAGSGRHPPAHPLYDHDPEPYRIGAGHLLPGCLLRTRLYVVGPLAISVPKKKKKKNAFVSRAQVDGNTEDRGVQEKFIGVLLETMTGGDREQLGDGTVLQDLERPETEPEAAGPSGSVAGPAVPRQNGYGPNAADGKADERGRNLRYDVRNLYAQIGSYPES